MASTIVNVGLLPAVGLCVLVLVPNPTASAASCTLGLSPPAATQGPPPPLQVVTVPWLGLPNQPHQVYRETNGTIGEVILQGIARLPSGCSITAATWDPDGPNGPLLPQAVPFGNSRVLELPYTYPANTPNGQVFVAKLRVATTCGVASDTMRVIVLNRTLDVDVNMAIDKGLWNLHKRQVLSSVGGVDTGYWVGQAYGGQINTAANTASAVLAMEVNGHHPLAGGGDTNEDPYVEDVERGLAHVFTELSSIPIGPQGTALNDPDSNGNGIGLQVTSAPIYVGGQVVDAIVASNADKDTTFATTGPVDVINKSYGEIVQDMMDAYAWGQTDDNGCCPSSRGGWRYGWNGDSDNSTSQWWGIGGIAAQLLYGTVIPAFVKSENLTYWIPQSQFYDTTNTGNDGRLGYTDSGYIVDINGMNTTPSGLVQMILDGVPQTGPDPNGLRFEAAVRFMIRDESPVDGVPENWALMLNNNVIYGMFSTAKAMRLALPNQITLMNGTFNWYRSDTTAGDPINGLARHLVNIQQTDGSWDSGGIGWVYDDLASAWAIVILSPTIVQLHPEAICELDPESTGVGVQVEYDGSGSFHQDPAHQIVSWEWDFGDGSPHAFGEVVYHSYAAIGNYNVTLTVTDDNNPPLIDDSTCGVDVIPPPNPPDANPGGPYVFCLGINRPFILNGTGSTDPDGNIVSYGWDFNPQPLDNSFDDATTPTVNVTAFFTSLGPGFYDVGLRVTDNDTNVNTDFTTVEVRTEGPCPPPDNPFVSFCFGDGTEAPCPCGNNGLEGHGCNNSANTGGAVLSASGDPSVSADTVVLTSSGELPSALTIFFSGPLEIPHRDFGDGLRCTGGHLSRLYVKNAVNGVATAPASGDPSITARMAGYGTPIHGGETHQYQAYYRDPAEHFCLETRFNASSGIQILWGP